MLSVWRAARVFGLVVGAASPAASAVPLPQSLLDPMFQDHAVLQRGRPIPVWGEARAGDLIAVSINGTAAEARVDAAGHWHLSLPAVVTGGPYSLSVRASSGATQLVSDVLVGDVWLCSGQSNMELPVSSTSDAARELSGPISDRIRILSIAHSDNPRPLEHFAAPIEWRVAESATIRDFSAACYYFARELQKAVQVPFGLIQSTWGGSSIEPWISAAGLRPLGGFDQRLDLLSLYARDERAGNESLAKMWEGWWRARAPAGSAPWKAAVDKPDEWREAPEPMRDWKTWGVPEFTNHDGMAWFRRTVTLTPEQAASAVAMSLGAIDEVDETWVNGRAIGNSFGYGTERTYPVPAGVLHAGENSIVVNVLSTWDAAGMYGPPSHMAVYFADGSSVGLGGHWRYQFVPESMGYPPRAPWESVGGLTSIYNAMIAPIGPYALRGVLWYQGESNTGSPGQYQPLLAGLMADWRRQFGDNLPFLVVQLPNFGAPVVTPVASGWASLREAQRRAVDGDRHAALAVSIDIGDSRDLHPPNKQDVGRRLARAARHLIYGEAASPSGPAPLAARRQNDHVVVTFTMIDGALVTRSSSAAIGFELCGDTQATCRFVNAAVGPDRVVLDMAGGSEPTRVRFCWGDSPVCNLYDSSGLPAGPFELEIR